MLHLFFDTAAYESVVALYQKHYTSARDKADTILATHHSALEQFSFDLAHKSLHSAGRKSLKFLHAKGLADEQTIELLEHTHQS